MIGKFNITHLGKRDQILLRIPWLHAMDPLICWRVDMLSLPHTPKSDLIKEDVDTEQKKNRLPPLFDKTPKYAHSKLLKRSVKPECIDSMILTPIKSVKPECIDSMIPLSASIEEVPDKEELVLAYIPNESSKTFNTKEDIWDNFEPPITDISTYLLHDDNILIEYQSDGLEMHIIENISFDTPLT
jgi:hypothetical protein